MATASRNTRTAVVVGAASGMGAAAAHRLHNDGYDLVLADLSIERLKEPGQRLKARVLQTDVTRDETVAALAAGCAGGVDALVVSAGLSMSMAPFERILEVNLAGSARVLRHFLPVMRPGSAAVCLASIAGHLSGPVDAALLALLAENAVPDFGSTIATALPAEMRISGMAYALSKLGILKLVEAQCAQWGRRGARLCSVSPGLIDTPMGELERKTNPHAEEAVGVAPIPRLGTAEEVANVVGFLCSPQASYVTGCDLLVDGGWVGAIHSASEDSPFARALAAGRQKN